MRGSDVRDPLISCADYHCSHSTRISAEQRPDDVRLSDLEPLFACTTCGKCGADTPASLATRENTGTFMKSASCSEPFHGGELDVLM
jgi:hypothetical protein